MALEARTDALRSCEGKPTASSFAIAPAPRARIIAPSSEQFQAPNNTVLT